MQEDVNAPGGLLARLWKARRSFRGFGLLLFYCHMLMLFSALARFSFGGAPEYAALLGLGRILVPLLFALTTLSLFWPAFFWLGLALGFLHLPLAAALLLDASDPSGPASFGPWLAGLAGLAALLLFTLRIKLKS